MGLNIDKWELKSIEYQQSCNEEIDWSTLVVQIMSSYFWFLNLQVQDIAEITGDPKLIKLWKWISRIFLNYYPEPSGLSYLE